MYLAEYKGTEYQQSDSTNFVSSNRVAQFLLDRPYLYLGSYIQSESSHYQFHNSHKLLDRFE